MNLFKPESGGFLKLFSMNIVAEILESSRRVNLLQKYEVEGREKCMSV